MAGCCGRTGEERNGTSYLRVVMVGWGIPVMVLVRLLSHWASLAPPKKVKKPLVVSGCRCASAPAGVPDYWENPRKGRRKFSSLIFRAASM